MRFQKRSEVSATPITSVHVVPAERALHAFRPLVGMEQQRYAPIENAASERTVYPAHPSHALLSSIEARRLMLTQAPYASLPERWDRERSVSLVRLEVR